MKFKRGDLVEANFFANKWHKAIVLEVRDPTKIETKCIGRANLANTKVYKIRYIGSDIVQQRFHWSIR